MPDLVRIPDSRADAGAGATGWAFGSQMCSGKAPALAPKPASMRAPARYSFFLSPKSRQAPGRLLMSSVPVYVWRRASPMRSAIPPMTATAR